MATATKGVYVVVTLHGLVGRNGVRSRNSHCEDSCFLVFSGLSASPVFLLDVGIFATR